MSHSVAQLCSTALHLIDEESQKLLTFASPTGRYCWSRLLYGLKSALEVFQEVLGETLQFIPGVGVGVMVLSSPQ